MTHWTKPTDELPEFDTPVLVVTGLSDRVFIAQRMSGHADTWRDDEWIFFETKDVKIWMPLPTLPAA
jgi:hypothetical protein